MRNTRESLIVGARPCYHPTAMLSMKALMRFLDRGFVFRALLVVMLYSLIPFGECFLLVMLTRYLDRYLLLAGVAATALVGILVSARPITRALETLHKSIDEGRYPAEPFAVLAGTLVAATLLVTPGFITDAFGFILLTPFLRRFLGRLITAPMRPRLTELYEYIKLYER